MGVARVQGDADARAELELGAGDVERLGERLEDPRAGLDGDLLGVAIAIEVAEQEQELVAALAGEQVAGARGHRQPLGRLAQYLVAAGVAERVVDELEAVEVDVDEPDGAAAAPRARERLGEVLLEQRAVGQAGQPVVVGEVRDLALGLAALGDVDGRAQRTADAPVLVVEDRVVPRQRPQLAAARDHVGLGRGVARRDVAGDEALEVGAPLVHLLRGGAGGEPVTAHEVALVVAEQLVPGVVEHLDVAGGIEDEDHRAGEVEVALGAVTLLAQPPLRALAIGDVAERVDEPVGLLVAAAAQRTAVGRHPPLAVLVDEAHEDALARDALAQGGQRRARARVDAPPVREEDLLVAEVRRPAPDDRRGGEAEDAAGARVGGDRHAVAVEHDHALVERGDDGAVELAGDAQRGRRVEAPAPRPLLLHVEDVLPYLHGRHIGGLCWS